MTGLQVKRRLKVLGGYEVEQQSLLFNGLEIPDENYLANHNICIILIIKCPNPKDIEIRFLDKSRFTIPHKKNLKLTDIKMEVYHQFEIKPEKQRLIYQGRELFDDDKLLSEFYFLRGNVLILNSINLYHF
jgi:hypothetical protein